MNPFDEPFKGHSMIPFRCPCGQSGWIEARVADLPPGYQLTCATCGGTPELFKADEPLVKEETA